MLREIVELTTRDGVAKGYLTRPDDRSYPGVLLIADAFGLRSTIEEMADRVAADGYVVLAPDVFYRAGRSPLLAMDRLAPERVAADGGDYLDYLDKMAAPGPMAITGYCIGGRIAWWMAAAHPDRVAGLALFHTASLVTDGPGSPHRLATNLKAEVYLGYADQDPGIDAEHIATLDRALQEAGVQYRNEVYAGARHGYTMADQPAFDPGASERHFSELYALLKRTLG